MKSAAPWYRDGLRFTCTQCGNCCTGEPGFVWVTEEEIQRLADHLELTIDQFGSRYLRRVESGLSLIEHPNGDCVFFDRTLGCTVYEARPIQCRTWPFWDENLESKEQWELTCEVCPGAGQGQWFSLVEIQDAAAQTRSL